jgi:hypothetical protein
MYTLRNKRADSGRITQRNFLAPGSLCPDGHYADVS